MTEKMAPKMDRAWFSANNFALAIGAILQGTDSGLHRLAPLAEGERRLGWFVLPPFQRPAVWTEAQKVRFIESIWGGLPLGGYVYNRVQGNTNSPYDAYLLDGQQRITSILDYVADAFPVLGYRWSELTKIDQQVFKMIPMSCMETSIEDIDKLKDIYDRLAYGGTVHEPPPEKLRRATRAALSLNYFNAYSYETDTAAIDIDTLIESNNTDPWRTIDAHERDTTTDWRAAERRVRIIAKALA